MHGVMRENMKRTREVPSQFRNDIPRDANVDEMSTLLQQLSYKYEADKFGESALDATKGNPANLPPHPSWRGRQRRLDILNTVPERDNNNSRMQHLQQHEREQHIHQLQSINNLLLELPVPSSPVGSGSESFTMPQTSKYQGDVAVGSPTGKGPGVSGNLEDTSISDLFGLGLPRGSLMAAGQKEQGGQSNFDGPSKLSYSNYPLMRDTSGTEYLSNTSSAEQHDNNSSGYYSNSTNMDVPKSPVLVHTPASPSTPGSLYSNAYSYSSAGSSPYTSSGSSVTNSYNKQSPVRSPCYGRAIRGSTPYSSPSAELPPNFLNWNGSRSDSPADSENSVNSVDGPLSDFVNYLSLNAGQPCYYPTNPSTLLEVEKYFERKGRSSIEQKLKKYLENQQVPQVQQHFQHHHPHQHQQRGHYNQQHNNGPYVNSNFESEKGCCVITRNTVPNQHPAHVSLDKAARFHRNAACKYTHSVSDATYTWSGTLPLRTQNPFGYSSKVFLGGVPWDITESILISTFKQFGPIKIEWPGKNQTSSQPKGYVYIVFESEKQVKALLTCCILDVSNGGSYYYKISSKRMKGKEVQVIPWALNDSNYVKSSSQKLDPEKTVFVGALHGMMTAKGLAKIMNDLFDNVIYAGIDTDKHKYPIGSARVTFSSKYSFNKAINAAFLEVKTSKFTKKLQVDPYIEDAPCSSCYVQQGPYFCRERTCFKYYCHTCWQWVHNNESIGWHKPMSRGLKNNQMIGLNSHHGSGRSLIN